MNILAIETSCDETGVSLVQCSHNNHKVSFEALGNALLSQEDIHAKYGGVFPSVAKREHSYALVPLIENVLADAGLVKNTPPQDTSLADARSLLDREPHIQKEIEKLASYNVESIDAIAVTVGPGLAPALWVGVNTARALATLWNKPLIPVNHMHGHLFSALYPEGELYELPALVLLVSGGHTEILTLSEDHSIQQKGSTRDDAIGEAFDKAARILELGYPGGPAISALAEKTRHEGLTPLIELPRPMTGDDTLDVSYSGLKTALLYHVRENPITTESERMRLALAFEEAALDVILTKFRNALEIHPVSSIVVGGGVIANKQLQTHLGDLADEFGVPLYLPTQDTTTDNALMITVAAYVATEFMDADPQRDVANIGAIANLSSHSLPQ